MICGPSACGKFLSFLDTKLKVKPAGDFVSQMSSREFGTVDTDMHVYTPVLYSHVHVRCDAQLT